MQLSKEEYVGKRRHNGSSVQIENSVIRVTVWHHSASCKSRDAESNPRDENFNPHLTTIKDSYIPHYKSMPVMLQINYDPNWS